MAPPQWEAAIRTYERRGFTRREPYIQYDVAAFAKLGFETLFYGKKL